MQDIAVLQCSKLTGKQKHIFLNKNIFLVKHDHPNFLKFTMSRPIRSGEIYFNSLTKFGYSYKFLKLIRILYAYLLTLLLANIYCYVFSWLEMVNKLLPMLLINI